MHLLNLALLFIAVAGNVSAGDKGVVKLFNGKNLDGWQTGSRNWIVEKGVIALQDRSDGKMVNAYYLWTKDEYGDFVLELEYKVLPERANSGVFIRTANLGDPVQSGIEIQVANARPNRPLSRGRRRPPAPSG